MKANNPIELLKHRKFEFDPWDLKQIQSMAKNHLVLKNYDLEDIDIDQVAQDNNLDNDSSMATRRANWWGKDINKYSITPEKLKNSYYTDPIRVKETSDGKLRIADGHHRLKALKNMGYTQIPAFVLRS